MEYLNFFIIHFLFPMGLLGKTLKGRSTREGGIPPAKNVKIRQIAKTQEEFDQLKKLSDIKKSVLRSKITSEHKFVNFNKKKLLTYWRKIMRMAKTEELRSEIEIISQNHQRELDSKEAFIQMLDKNLDEAEDQYQMALRNHLIHMENLMNVQDARIKGLQEEFKRDVEILENEYNKENNDMERTNLSHIKELEDTIETVKEEQRKRYEEAKQEEQAFREEIKNRNLEEESSMKTILDTKQGNNFTQLEQMSQKYSADTEKRTQEHKRAYETNKSTTKSINELQRKIAMKKAKMDLQKLKTLQHRKECSSRNAALKKQKDNILKNYQQLKIKMTRFRDEQEKRLTQLANNSRNAVEKLKNYEVLGEKILKTAELCRKLETEKQKVIPFYQSSTDEYAIVDQSITSELTEEQLEQFRYMNNFYKRHNKVLLDKMAIQKQKQTLITENSMFKSLLKQYLDGISVNDDVMNNNNPLLVVNNKINIVQMPVEHLTKNHTIINGNFAVSAAMNQLGYIPARAL